MPTVLPTLSHRDPRPRFFVGALRPTVGNTAGTIFLFLVRYFMTFQAYVYLSLPRSKDSDLRSLCKVRTEGWQPAFGRSAETFVLTFVLKMAQA